MFETTPNAAPAASKTGAVPASPLARLSALGQSVWLDYIDRALLEGDALERMMREDGLAGITSNPSIFRKAIAEGRAYDPLLRELAAVPGMDPKTAYERLAARDICLACDHFRPMFERSEGRDGYVSFEISPDLAHDTDASLAEGRRLWALIGRPNLMIKVPATEAGMPVIEQLIAEGINVNVTLLFSMERYERTVAAYLTGIEQWVRSRVGGRPPASVASVFVSRIDTLVDKRLRQQVEAGLVHRSTADALSGKVAIANAKLIYERSQALFSGARWRGCRQHGARPQRLLWASTGSKNKRYRDVLYVEELVGEGTVNTMAPQTYAAFREHGCPRLTVTQGLDGARQVLERLGEAGVSLAGVTAQLEVDGLRLFGAAFHELLAHIERRIRTP